MRDDLGNGFKFGGGPRKDGVVGEEDIFEGILGVKLKVRDSDSFGGEIKNGTKIEFIKSKTNPFHHG